MDQARCFVIRVGFVFSFDDGWLGGINYFRNLLIALYAYPERKIEAVVFTGVRTTDEQLLGFPSVKIVRCSMFDRGSFLWRARYWVIRKFAYDYLLHLFLRSRGIAVLSHSGWLGKNATIPTIGWIPDFQHVRLSELFSNEEIEVRDRGFRNICQFCSKVILSSYDAQNDLRRFDPDCVRKSGVLQFVVSSTSTQSALPGREELETRYNFSGKYFLLPNQFWKHKNHRVVIEALGILASEGRRVQILATGSASDYRHPDYFQSLMNRAEELSVMDDFKHLGLVSMSDLSGLMFHAQAIINPSLFEGWSTTVEEAKSLGKPVILSDIPVHREQDPPLASFFAPDDANGLATRLWDVWNQSGANEYDDAEHARRANDERRLVFARQYHEIVLNTLENR